MRITTSDLGGCRSYFDEEQNRFYGRIVTALSWPRERGFVCIVAAGLHSERGTTQKPFYVLAEADATDLHTLLQKTMDLHDLYRSEIIYALQDETFGKLVHSWNKSNTDRKMLTAQAPHSENDHIEFHVNLIKGKLHPDKQLHFFEGSRLPGCLAAVQAGDVQTAVADLFPEVAALGFACAGLEARSGGLSQQESSSKYASFLENPLDYQG